MFVKSEHITNLKEGTDGITFLYVFLDVDFMTMYHIFVKFEAEHIL
jgi:hypothetical protein